MLGIDPGLTATGYGVLEHRGRRLEVVESGTIRPPSAGDLGGRLRKIYRGLSDVIARCRPEVAAVEDLFMARNVRSTLMLGQARGVAVLAAAESGLEVYEYSPLQVKQAVVGYGRAEKGQVQKMLIKLLSLPAPPDSADAADALAVALCHVGHAGVGTGRPSGLLAGSRRGRR